MGRFNIVTALCANSTKVYFGAILFRVRHLWMGYAHPKIARHGTAILIGG